MQRRITWILGFLMSCSSCTSAGISHADTAKPPAKQPTSAPTGAVAMERGETAFQAQKWAEAAQSFEAVVKADPKNGRAWMRLGASLHAANEFNKAIAAWQKAVEVQKAPVAMYNLACSHARAGHVDDAIQWIDRAIDAGFGGAAGMRKDADLASLLSDKRFIALAEKAERIAAPCRFDAEFKQFDFWIGEWDVFTPAGQKAGENNVFSASNGCLVMENWTGTFGDSGKSMNFYDPARKQWRQIWVGSGGAITEFVGEFKDGAMRFVGETKPGMENAPQRRLTFFHVNANEVRQLAEKSTDGGKTFATEYDFTYRRRAPKQ